MMIKLPEINTSKFSEKAILISNQLFDYSLGYQSRCIVILDPFLEPINDEVMQYLEKLNRVRQIRIMHSAIKAKKRPLLVELNLLNVFERQILTYFIDKSLMELPLKQLSYGNGRQYCGWLFSQASMDSLADDFAHLALQKVSQNSTYFLRFYDPAIFLQLMMILEDWQRRKIYTRVETWVVLDSNGDLQINKNEGQIVPTLSGQLGITEPLLKQLFCIGINNQILKIYRNSNSSLYINEIDSFQKIEPCLLRLMAKQIHDESLMIEWGMLALKYYPDFDLHPHVITSTANFKTRYDYYHWLESMTVEDWKLLINSNEISKKDNGEIK